MEAMRHIIIRPLNQLTAEEDFILGAMLDMTFASNANDIAVKKKV